jgi:hypothetical protein
MGTSVDSGALPFPRRSQRYHSRKKVVESEQRKGEKDRALLRSTMLRSTMPTRYHQRISQANESSRRTVRSIIDDDEEVTEVEEGEESETEPSANADEGGGPANAEDFSLSER